MLAWADVVAAASACLAAVFAGGGDVGASIWSLAFLPIWVGLAKGLGLYDRDERARAARDDRRMFSCGG